MKPRTLLFTFIFLFVQSLVAQTNISGIINSYAPVTSISGSTLTVGGFIGATHTLICGDRVMIIQMKGASINTSNSASFGNITSIGNAGNYEMATVQNVVGSVVTLSQNLSNSYTVSGLIQLVYVPHYENVNVSAVLRSEYWNGSAGGVMALEVDGTITLNANISAFKRGFQGGAYHLSSVTPPNAVSCGFGQEENVGVDFFYTGISLNKAVEKGESITVNTGFEYGKGKLASGGGGGGMESGGGGGGAHIGTGGNGGGGNPLSSGFFCGGLPDVAGKGGNSLVSFTTNKVFFGGGSGAGNNGNVNGYYIGSDEINAAVGNNGGGLVYISSNSIEGNSRVISAAGESGYIPSGLSNNFGGAGGGAGGTIILNVNHYIGTLNVRSQGGTGSSVSITTTNSRRRGAGGGGGGGKIYFSSSSTPAGVVTDVTGGAGGQSFYNSGSTNAASHNGTAGMAGSILYNYSETGTDSEAVNLVSSTTSKTEDVNSSNRVDFSNSGLLASINSQGNDLGNTSITASIGLNGPFTSDGCSTDEYYLPRYFDIVPTNQPSSDCDVSLYITKAELDAFILFTNAQTPAYKDCWGAVNSSSDLMITAIHSDLSVETINPSIIYISCSEIYRLDFSVNKFSTFYIHSNKGAISGNPLPVEWLSFHAESISENDVKIYWLTATEINNEGFSLERSIDGFSFEEIAWIKGNGNVSSKSEYLYIDNVSGLENISRIYYRLKQIDFDSNFEYSKIISVEKIQKFEVGNLFPNPTNGKTFFEISSLSETSANIEIYNYIGKLVYSKSIEVNEGFNKFELDLSNFYIGVYISYVNLEDKKFIKRLIKK